jgi:peptidoglycan/xylan/chitin deacetylase (PgdA/CDA1 family)
VPAIKPLGYYLAVDGYQRYRVARARRRGGRERQPDGVRILAYHRVSAERDVLAVHPSTLRRQLEHLLASPAQVVTLDAALDLLEEPVHGRYVAVTFDDGYRDTLEVAAPILRELGVPATVFLPTGVLDGTAAYDWYRRRPAPPAMTWDEVTALRRDGLIGVGSHSRTHPCLPALPEARVREELARSKARIERHTGAPVSSFCYPAGLYGTREVRLVAEAGYRAAVTCRNGINPGGAGLGELRRDLIGWRDDVERFALKLSGALDASGALTEAMQRRRSRPR